MTSDGLRYDAGLPSDAKVLVTGGSGFIGTNLVHAYREAGVTVLNADASKPRNAADADVFRQVDFLDAAAVKSVVDDFQPTHVFHLAARTDLDGVTLSDYAVNIEGVTNVIEALRGLGPVLNRVVMASSRMVCEIGYQPKSDTDYRPSTPYGESKVRTEELTRPVTDLPWLLVRPTSIWGPWFDIPYRDFFLSIAKGRYVHPRGRRIDKNFGYVGNTIWQLHSLMTADDDAVLGKTFYLADNPPLEVRDFADRISRALSTRKAPNVPLPVLKGLAVAGDTLEKTGRRAPLTSFRLANLLTNMYYELGPLEDVVGPPPIGLDQGVAETVAWLRLQQLV
ncbi:MAG: NAD(P)-dependent oxidoreductase [Solirubrobacteraceae bacterium]|nr:NAD(P)-dependent oxidoreductase [Solirubrobacteraceae bacterium]